MGSYFVDFVEWQEGGSLETKAGTLTCNLKSQEKESRLERVEI
jgi:hypothetical protein